MYPGIDRTKPPGIIPGMILNHPALHPDGRMRLDPCLELQEHLIEDYSKEDSACDVSCVTLQILNLLPLLLLVLLSLLLLQ